MAIAIGGNQINKAYLGTTEIQKMYLGSELVFDNSIQPSELTPIMTTFRVEDANKDRVYFDTPLGPVTGLTTTGLSITGKSVDEIDTVNNYITVSSDFNHWNNNTIRLESGNGVVFDFTMEHISNDISATADTANPFYVDGSVGASGDGSSEGTAFKTIMEAITSITSTRRDIWIKAFSGTYNEQVNLYSLGYSPTSSTPVKIRGYKTSIGDLDGVKYYTYPGSIVNTDAPTIYSNGGSGMVTTNSRNYIIVENIQAEDCAIGFYNNGATGIIWKNCVSYNSSSRGIYNTGANQDSRTVDCVGVNGDNAILVATGDYALIQGNELYSQTGGSGDGVDYFISSDGSFNIFKDNLSDGSNGGDIGGSHGCSISGDVVGDCEYNLIENQTSVGTGKGVELRRGGNAYNVVRNLNTYSNTVGMEIRDGANHNTIENSKFSSNGDGISWVGGVEPGDGQGYFNIFKNCIINNNGSAQRGNTVDGQTYGVENNEYLNCTFDNSSNLLEPDPLGNSTYANNKYTNCIFNDISNVGVSNGWTFDYNNFFGGFAAIGTNTSAIDPDFVDTTYYLPQGALQLAPKLSNVNYDRNGKQRDTTTTIGGVTLTSEQAGEQPPVVTADYYVSFTDGDDTNPGTELEPWQTLTKSREGMVAGNVIAYKRGDTWNELMNISNKNGTVNDNITLTAYGSGEKPIITAVYVYDLTWTSEGNSIWSSTGVDRTVVRLKIDGQEVLNGSEAELGTSIPDLVQFYSSGAVFKIYSLDSPENHVLEFSSHEIGGDYYNVAMGVAGSSYLNFDNIEFKGGYFEGINITTSDNISFANCSIGDMCNRGIYVDTSTNIFIDNNDFDTKFTLDYSGGSEGSTTVRGGSDGVLIKGLNVGTISDNNYKNWGHASFSLVGDTSIITGIKAFNNYMAIPDIPYGGAAGTDGVDCYGNEFYNNTYDGTKNVQFNGHNNHFHHNIIKNSKGTTLKANINGAGIRLQNYTDGVCYDNIVENNLIIDTENQGIYISGNNEGDVINNIVRNNIVYNCGSGSSNIGLVVYIDSGVGSNNGNFFYNNDIYSSLTTDTISYYNQVMDVDAFNGQSVEQTVDSNIADEPLFVGVGDYHQLEASPTVNAGTTALATLDYDGNTIPYSGTLTDIGIYESEWLGEGPELILNGDFSGTWVVQGFSEVPESWKKSGTDDVDNYAIEDNDHWFFTGTGSNNVLCWQNNVVELGKNYKLTFNITTLSGEIRFRNSSLSTTYDTYNAIGEQTTLFTAVDDAGILFATFGASSATIDNVSIKEVL